MSQQHRIHEPLIITAASAALVFGVACAPPDDAAAGIGGTSGEPTWQSSDQSTEQTDDAGTGTTTDAEQDTEQAGDTDVSTTSDLDLDPDDLPVPPPENLALAYDDEQITVRWTPPLDSDGRIWTEGEITGYGWELTRDGEDVASGETEGDPMHLEHLDPGDYTLIVYALDGREGGPGGEVAALDFTSSVTDEPAGTESGIEYEVTGVPVDERVAFHDPAWLNGGYDVSGSFVPLTTTTDISGADIGDALEVTLTTGEDYDEQVVGHRWEVRDGYGPGGSDDALASGTTGEDSFTVDGLEPGQYTLVVTAEDGRLHGVGADPTLLQLTVEETEDGTLVHSLDEAEAVGQ